MAEAPWRAIVRHDQLPPIRVMGPRLADVLACGHVLQCCRWNRADHPDRYIGAPGHWRRRCPECPPKSPVA